MDDCYNYKNAAENKSKYVKIKIIQFPKKNCLLRKGFGLSIQISIWFGSSSKF